MKKHLIVWGMVGILVGGVMNIKPANAVAVDEDGMRWFDVAELLEMAEETAALRHERCGDNLECEREIYDEMMMTDQRYQAMNLILSSAFMVTGINVKDSKVRLLLNDEDMMMKWFMPVRAIFKEIGLMQYECETDEECGQKFLEIMNYIIERTPMESPIPLYRWQNESEEQILPIHEEFEVDISDIEVEHESLGLKTGFFQAFMIADTTNSLGGIDYTECLGSEEYEEGMWCKMMISEEMRIKYIPAWEESTETGDEIGEQEIDKEPEDEVSGGGTDENVEPTENVTPVEGVSAVIEDGNGNDWEDDDWEDFWGTEDLGDEEAEELANFVETNELEYEEEIDDRKIVAPSFSGYNHKNYHMIGVTATAVAMFSFCFLIFCQKSRKKSEKRLDNFNDMV